MCAPKTIPPPGGMAGGGGQGLLRRPRAPVAPEPPEYPPECPESPGMAKSVVSEISAGINSCAGLYNYSPEPSIHPSVVSPPPPSERHSHHNYPHHGHPSHHRTRGQGYIIKRDNTKYVLDPLYRDNTNVGTYVEGRSLVKPYRHRGPAALPAKLPRRNPTVAFVTFGLDEDMERYYPPPLFTLQDFLIKVSQVQSLPLEKVKEVMFSKHNYKKVQKMLAQDLVPPLTEYTVTQMRPPGECH